MLKFLFRIAPSIGSKWTQRGGDPFCPVDVTILAIKQRWVKYSYNNSPVSTSAMPIRPFRLTYREVKGGD